jgi:hypothetical protein
MAQLWFDNAEVAARQASAAGVAIAVIEAPVCLPAAGDAKDGT